jgi:hypothetical protein
MGVHNLWSQTLINHTSLILDVGIIIVHYQIMDNIYKINKSNTLHS